MMDANNRNEEWLPTLAMQPSTYQKHVMDDLATTKNSKSHKFDNDNDNEERAGELNESAELTLEYMVGRLVVQTGKATNIKYVVRSYGYKYGYDIVKPPIHIPEHYITSFWRWKSEKDAVSQRCERSNANRKPKIPKYPTFSDDSKDKDEIWTNCKWLGTRQCSTHGLPAETDDLE